MERAFRYRLLMFGFSAMCEDLDEVRLRLRGYPAHRAASEAGDQCYLVDLQQGAQYAIVLRNDRFEVDEDTCQQL